MKTKTPLASAAVALAALSLLSTGCSKSAQPAHAWQPPRPVRIDGPGVWGNLFQSWPTCLTSADKIGPAGLLARDGDWLFSETHSKKDDDNIFYIYRASDGPVVKPTLEKGLLRVAGKVVGISIGKDSGGRAWLERATPAELAAVRVLSLRSAVDAAILPTFQKLAAVNPDVTVFTESAANLRLALQVFRPRAYFLPKEKEGDWKEVVATQRQVETLILERSALASLDVLPLLPNLRRLVISDWEADQNGALPPGLVTLKILHLWGTDVKDLSAFGPLPAGLEELSIVMSTQLSDISGLAGLAGLKALTLTGCKKVTDLSSLAGLQQLQSVGLPSGISQEQFAAFVAAHRNLKVLEIVGCNQVTDLTPLRELHGLEGLILTGSEKEASSVIASPQNVEVLRSLKSLRYLGISPGSGKEVSPEFAALRRALPDALVVPVAPLCLGSGWILVLLPVVALAAWRGSRRVRR